MERLFFCLSSTSEVLSVRGGRVDFRPPFVVLLFAGVRLVWCSREPTSLSVNRHTCYVYSICGICVSPRLVEWERFAYMTVNERIVNEGVEALLLYM